MADPYNLHKVSRFWHCDFTLLGTRVHKSTKCTAKPDAVERCERWAKEIRDRADGIETEKPAPTLRELWKEWNRLKASSTSASHRRWMEGCIHQHTGEYLDQPATAMTTAALEELRAAYLNGTGQGFKCNGGHTVRKHSEGGWNKVLTQFKALLNWAVDTERIPTLPFKPKGLKLKTSHQARGVLWPEQVQPFLALVDQNRKEREGDPFNHSAIACRLMIGLGLREAEALNLEWDRIDWRRNIAIVAEARTTGARVKDRTIREIAIPDWLRRILLVWWKHEGKPGKGLLLVKRGGGAHYEGATGKAVRNAATEMKIQGLTPHGLRRTFATGHWEMGTPLTQIAQWMGHEDPSITLKRYILLRPTKDQAGYQNKLGKAMGFKDQADLTAKSPEIIPQKSTKNQKIS